MYNLIKVFIELFDIFWNEDYTFNRRLFLKHLFI